MREKISRNILLLGMVSFLADVSSEMIMPLLPLFITSLGGAGLAIGLIGGIGDSIASILKVISGHWSDRLGKRKIFVSIGYASSALAKLFFPLATSWQHMLVLRPLERVGKGLRTAPRDAIIADYTTERDRGKGFGIHKAMDTAGAVTGSGLAFMLFWFLGLGFREIFSIAAGIAFLALIPLYFVKEKKTKKKRFTLKIGISLLKGRLKQFILFATVFSLGNFTYMFFILQSKGAFSGRMSLAAPILLYVLYNIVYASLSAPAGALSDRIGRKKVILLGYSCFALTCLGFAILNGPKAFALLFVLYGISKALTEAAQKALVSDLSMRDIRGTALGTFHSMTGIAILAGNLIAGALWQYINPATTFVYGAIMAIAAAGLFLRHRSF